MTDHHPRRGVSPVRSALGAATLGILLGILYLVQTHRVEHYEVTSNSMAPTLEIGDRLIKIPARRLVPGDIVIFHRPGNPEPLVKRLVAVGPARVELRRGRLFVDGAPADPPSGAAAAGPQLDGAWDVPPGWGFVVGDNRAESVDSRDFGPIPLADIVGIVSYRVYPPERRGAIDTLPAERRTPSRSAPPADHPDGSH